MIILPILNTSVIPLECLGDWGLSNTHNLYRLVTSRKELSNVCTTRHESCISLEILILENFQRRALQCGPWMWTRLIFHDSWRVVHLMDILGENVLFEENWRHKRTKLRSDFVVLFPGVVRLSVARATESKAYRSERTATSSASWSTRSGTWSASGTSTRGRTETSSCRSWEETSKTVRRAVLPTPRKYAFLPYGQLDFESAVTAQHDKFKGSFDISY